jgi:Putative bacterial sensory transduction regulator
VSDVHDDADLAVLERAIDAWLAQARAENPVVAAVDRDAEVPRRWYVRLRGEEKDVTTVWLTVGQRTVRYETYVMPAPEENHAQFYEHLLRRNDGLVGAHFSIGTEDAVFLRGELPVGAVTADELDRILGTVYAAVERCFRPALAIGFESRFRNR